MKFQTCLRTGVAALAFWTLSGNVVRADVDIEWRPETTMTAVGEAISLQAYVVASPDAAMICGGGSNAGASCTEQAQCPGGMCGEPFTVADLVIQWDPSALALKHDVALDTGPYQWMSTEFYDDRYLDGWNTSLDDGDAYYTLWARPMDFPVATPEGLLIVVFEFDVVGPTPGAAVDFLQTGGLFAITAIYDDQVGGLNIGGSVGQTEVVTLSPMTLTDHASFADCLGGPGSDPYPVYMTREACLEAFDFDLDRDVDGADWRWLQVVLEEE